MGFDRRRPVVPLSGNWTADSPGALLSRLGVRSGARVALIGVRNGELSSFRYGGVTKTWGAQSAEPVDVLVYQAENTWALRRVAELAERVGPSGAMWVLWPAGQEHITANHVARSAVFCGMVDVQTIEVSGRLAGTKFVRRPRDGRG